MNGKKLIRRAGSLLLAVLTLGGLLSFPGSRADDPEFDIDGSAFTEPKLSTGMMYFWHKGLPTVAKDKGGNFIHYPILITWKDQYFLCTDKDFRNELNETHTLQKKKNSNYVCIDGYEGFGYVDKDTYSHTKFDRVWGNCDYYMRYLYDTKDSALLAKLGMDVNDLTTLGEAVSLVQPEGLPFVVATKPETDQYAIGLNEQTFGANVWLVGQTKMWEWVPTDSWWGYDLMMCGDVQWCLEYQSWKPENFLNKDYTYNSNRSMYDVNAHKSYPYSEGPDQHYWTFKKDSDGLYHIWTMGENNIVEWGRISGTQGKEKNRQRLRDWYHANDLGRMSLYYSGSTIGVNGETVKYSSWDDRVNTVKNTDGFEIYYADPNIVSFHKDSFDVVKGQVVNLDGPRVIDSGCTVTVKDGGVLSCSGWVINNGQIIIEPGGMLILQERDTAVGDHQFGAITTVGMLPDFANGRIACDGIIIINRDCKLTCAGTYGLQLGDRAQVVNYGQIISENLEIYSDHAIENRGDSSAVFAGWGVTDYGYILTRTQITGTSYKGKGALQKTAAVTMPINAVYGDGVDRVYINPASSVTHEVSKRKQGFVSNVVPELYILLPGQDTLPPNLPIYYDDRYNVAYVVVDGVIYQYDSIVRYWVNVADGAHETLFDYRMPYEAEELISKDLPDGFLLHDGRVVGAVVKEDLYYDIHAHCYWFTEDMVTFYYEPLLKAYIHVEDSGSYYRYPTELAPPPSYNSGDSVPINMRKDMDISTMAYKDGMQEIDVADVKIQVKKDDKGFYIIVFGYRLDWSAEQQLFIPAEGSMPEELMYDENGDLRSVPPDRVNLNGYDLSDPNAKPKVQKDGDRYYVEIISGDFPGRYYWYSDYQEFFYGSPYNYAGKPIKKDQVDLNGYTLP